MGKHKEVMIEAAKAAGKTILEYRGRTSEMLKDDGSVLTEADEKAEKIVLEILTKEFPYNVLAEESGATENNSEYTWVIDPIDGTSNFARGSPYFGSMIALLHNGEAEIALLYDVLNDDMFVAEKDKGVERNGKPFKLGPLKKKVHVLHDDGPAKMPREIFMGTVGKAITTLNAYGISYLSICAEAVELLSGRAEVFICYGQSLWDFYPSSLVLSEAGFVVSDWKGEPWKAGRLDLVAARQEHLDKIVPILSEAPVESQSERL